MSAISEANADGSTAATESLVVFRVGEQRCALRIAEVERVVRAVEITPLPDAPGGVPGVVNIKGTIVPVYNLRTRLRLPERDLSPDDHLILARSRGQLIGLLADEVSGVTTVGAGDIIPSDDILPGLDRISGAFRLHGEIIFIYGAGEFLSPDETEKLSRAIITPAPEPASASASTPASAHRSAPSASPTPEPIAPMVPASPSSPRAFSPPP